MNSNGDSLFGGPSVLRSSGTGPIGLLATMALRLRDLEVVTLGLTKSPYLNSELVETIGARYLSTREMSLGEASSRFGPFDIIFEATGYAPLVFEAMEVLGKNGVLILTGISGEGREVSVPADAINRGFVLHNKAMLGTVNANRQHFAAGIRDLATCVTQYPGWLERLLTHRVAGLENHERVLKLFQASEGAVTSYQSVCAGSAVVGERALSLLQKPS